MQTREAYTEAFRQVLDALNPEQRKAALHLDGPLMVVAGPGTGKTQVLAARIGHILVETDTPASTILCLTFSDAGVQAMRKRLLQLIGPEAHRVTIATFHSFCNRVIGEHLALFGDANLALISDLERIDLVRQLLIELPAEHPLRIRSKFPFAFEQQVRDLFALLKKEAWTVDLVEGHIDTFLEGLPTNPDYLYKRNNRYGLKGAPMTGKINLVQEKMTRLRSAVQLYPLFQEALARSSRYEYDDMLLWVTDAFSRHSGLLSTYQERYLYVLVDEYQDTNGAQYKLLRQLLHFWEQPNVFIVGDDDQSVYEFQGARLRNLVDFHRQYQPETVVLVRNYRSGQNLLDASGNMIEHNALRAIRQLPIPLEKTLLAQGTAPAELLRLACENPLHEYSALVEHIGRRIQDGTGAGQIAVLYTRHKLGDLLQRLLVRAGIPCQVRKQANVLSVPVVIHLLEVLRLLALELVQPLSADAILFRWLHAPFLGLRATDLALIALYKRRLPEHIPWRMLIQSADHLHASGATRIDKLLEVGNLLEHWVSVAASGTLPELIAAVSAQSGLLEHAIRHPDKVWLLQALATLSDFAEASLERQPDLSLDHFVELTDRMTENRLELPMQARIAVQQGVSLMSVHAAKGLEYDYVYMPSCTAEHWEPSVRQASGGFTLPDTLTPGGEEDAMEARRRLFYVAMTRARKGLYLSYPLKDHLGKDTPYARFVDETGIAAQTATPVENLALQQQIALMSPPEKPMVQLPEGPWLEERLSSLALSISAINRYLTCPLSFYYEDLLQVPTPKRPTGAFGEAVHMALRKTFEQFPAGGREPVLLRHFDAEMQARKGFFPEDIFQQQLHAGKSILSRFHQTQRLNWQANALVERKIDQCTWKHVPLSGTIDRIEWTDEETLLLTDFKTGRPDKTKIKPPDNNQPLGGAFWRQIVFYSLLLRQSGLFPKASTHLGAIAWVEPDRDDRMVTETLAIQEGDLDMVGRVVVQVYDEIRMKQFQKGCGKLDCPWCQMTALERLSQDQEGLDDD